MSTAEHHPARRHRHPGLREVPRAWRVLELEADPVGQLGVAEPRPSVRGSPAARARSWRPGTGANSRPSAKPTSRATVPRRPSSRDVRRAAPTGTDPASRPARNAVLHRGEHQLERQDDADDRAVSRQALPWRVRSRGTGCSGRRLMRRGRRRTRRDRRLRGRRPLSPRPTSFTGMPSWDWMATTMPPLAEPSSLVSTTPVTSTASVNCWACTRPFCPVVASSTSSTSLTEPGALLGHPPDLAQLLHEVDLGVQAPGGVGQHQVGAPGRGPLDRVEDHRARDRRPRRRARSRPRSARPTCRAARRPRPGTCRRRP